MGVAEGDAESMATKVADLTTSLNNILVSLQGMEKWIPCVDNGIRELNKSMEGIEVHVTALEASTPMNMKTPVGPRVEEQHQGAAVESLAAQERTLGRGKRQFPHSPIPFELGESSERGNGVNGSFRSGGTRLPKTDCPRFDGDNPKLWKTNCEKYFHMYQVPFESWAAFATLHFTGNAALWLQTYEELHSVESWAEFCVAVHSKFGRDKYQEHLEELDGLVQMGSVEEYHSRFEELMHRVLVYNKGYDETYFVTKFVGGLKTEIKIAIKLHKPRTVDAALSLAKTQEELLNEAGKKGYSKTVYKEPYKPQGKPSYKGKGILGPTPEEPKKVEEKPKWEDRFESLKSARRARGECFKCGEKWGPGHKCPKSVQLHILEELLEVFQIGDANEGEAEEGDSGSEEELVISECAMTGSSGRKTIRLEGLIQKHHLLILVDSGSTSNFLAERVAEKLNLPVRGTTLSQVTIADGGKMTCAKVAPGV